MPASSVGRDAVEQAAALGCPLSTRTVLIGSVPDARSVFGPSGAGRPLPRKSGRPSIWISLPIRQRSHPTASLYLSAPGLGADRALDRLLARAVVWARPGLRRWSPVRGHSGSRLGPLDALPLGARIDRATDFGNQARRLHRVDAGAQCCAVSFLEKRDTSSEAAHRLRTTRSRCVTCSDKWRYFRSVRWRR